MKRARIPAVMWLVVILVHAYLSIADSAKTTDTTSVCDGSVQDCLIGGHLEPEFPTITTSHFGRMLDEVNTMTGGTINPNKSSCPVRNNNYADCFPPRVPKPDATRCQKDPYYRVHC